MVYKTKKCPHCFKSYSFMEPKGTGFYGSPIRICEHCGKVFIDKEFREIAVDGVREVDKRKVSTGTLLMLIIPIYFIIGGLLGNIPVLILGLVILAGIIFLIVSESRGYEERQSYLKAEQIKSEKRLSDINYALALKDLGYNVPMKYLQQKTDVSETSDNEDSVSPQESAEEVSCEENTDSETPCKIGTEADYRICRSVDLDNSNDDNPPAPLPTDEMSDKEIIRQAKQRIKNSKLEKRKGKLNYITVIFICLSALLCASTVTLAVLYSNSQTELKAANELAENRKVLLDERDQIINTYKEERSELERFAFVSGNSNYYHTYDCDWLFLFRDNECAYIYPRLYAHYTLGLEPCPICQPE